MLRSLGSSLVAKAGIGSRSRDVDTQNIEQPNLPDKGQIGTVQRNLVQDPLERPVPQGSEKVIASQPIVESGAVTPDDFANLAPNVIAPVSATPNVQAGGNNQALFQGGVGSPQTARPAAQVSQGVSGRVTASSGGVAQRATGQSGANKVVAPVVYQAPQAEEAGGGIGAFLGNILGGKAYAESPGQVAKPSSQVGQQIINKGLQNSGQAAQKINSNPTLRSLTPSKPAPSAQLKPSTGGGGNILKTVSNLLRSLNPFK